MIGKRLFGLYQEFMHEELFSFTEIFGQGQARIDRAVSALGLLVPRLNIENTFEGDSPLRPQAF